MQIHGLAFPHGIIANFQVARAWPFKGEAPSGLCVTGGGTDASRVGGAGRAGRFNKTALALTSVRRCIAVESRAALCIGCARDAVVWTYARLQIAGGGMEERTDAPIDINDIEDVVVVLIKKLSELALQRAGICAR